MDQVFLNHRNVTADAKGSQSVDRTILLLKFVASRRGAGAALAELVSGSGISKPTVRRLMIALIRAGLIEQDGDTRRYYLGPESYVIGTLAADRHGIHRLALDGLVRLAHRTEDTTFLTVRRDTFAVCLHREEGAFPIRTLVLSAGDRYALGAGAGSLAILAALPDPVVDAVIGANGTILAERYPRLTAEVLRGLVQETRWRGFAVNRGLIMPGSWGVGVAVHDPSGKATAALSIAAIENRMGEQRQEELARLLHEEARTLEARLREFEKLKEERDGAALLQRDKKPVS